MTAKLRKGPSGPPEDKPENSFINLTDTPDNYPEVSNQALVVNRESNGVSFETQGLDNAQQFYACGGPSGTSMFSSGFMTAVSVDTGSGDSQDKDGAYLNQAGAANTSIYTDTNVRKLSLDQESEALLKFKLTLASNIRFNVGVLATTSFQLVLDSDNPNIGQVGVRYSTVLGENTFHFIASNGGPPTTVDSGVPVTTDAFYVRVVSSPSKESFTVSILGNDFALLASHEFTSNIPLFGTYLAMGVGIRGIGIDRNFNNYFMKAVIRP